MLTEIEDAYGAYTVQRMNAVVRVEKALLAVVDDAIRAKKGGAIMSEPHVRCPVPRARVDRDAVAHARDYPRHRASRRMQYGRCRRVAAWVDALHSIHTRPCATGPSARRVGARVLRAVRWALAALVHLSERPHGHPSTGADPMTWTKEREDEVRKAARSALACRAAWR